MTMRTVAIRMAGAALGASALLVLGCAFGEINWSDPLKRSFTLQDAQRQYTEYVRWSAFDKASGYVEPQAREEFLAQAASIKELRFTDYEFDPVQIDEETGQATVEVTYLAYQLHSPIEIRVTEIQRWRRQGRGNSWMVRPSFADLNRPVGSRGQ